MLSVLAATGCATLGATQGAPGSASAPASTVTSADMASAPPYVSTPAGPATDDMSPRLIIPVTGGPPVIGIPVGGGLFVPVTGGAPVMGIPTGP
jgi:hypothetical protein